MCTMFACVATLLRPFFPPLTNVPAFLPYLPPHKCLPYFLFLPPLKVISFSSMRTFLTSFLLSSLHECFCLPALLSSVKILPSFPFLPPCMVLPFLYFLPISFRPSFDTFFPPFLPSFVLSFIHRCLPSFLPSFLLAFHAVFLHKLHMCLSLLPSFLPAFIIFLPT